MAVAEFQAVADRDQGGTGLWECTVVAASFDIGPVTGLGETMQEARERLAQAISESDALPVDVDAVRLYVMTRKTFAR